MMPEEGNLQVTEMIEGRHPSWNQQFFINNPDTVTNQEGFVFFGLRDKYQSKTLEEFYIPINAMKPFCPYNFEMIMANANYDKKTRSRGKIYISIVLEKPDEESFTDTLTDIIIHNTSFDPLPL